MSLRLQQLLYPYLAPAGEAGGGAGASLDRGDDHAPTDDEPAAPAAKEKDEPAPPAPADDDGKDVLTDDERKQGKYVPRERLSEVTRKAREKEEAYQAELRRLNEALESNKVDATIEQIDARIDELDTQYDEHMMNGEKEKARAAKAEMRRYEKARTQMVSQAYSVQAQLAAIEQYRYDNVLDTLEAQYDVLNEKSDAFDAGVTQEIADLMSFHQNKGMSKADALRKATTTLLGPPKAAGTAPDANALRAERTAEARKKAAATVGGQPPDISKLGTDSDKLGGGKPSSKDLLKMNQEQFAKLDEETLRTLRGDDFVGEAA